MLLGLISYAGNCAIDFLSWYESNECLWKLALIPVCIIAYAIMIISDAFDMILDRLEE